MTTQIYSDVVWNGYNDLINNGNVTLAAYNELQAVCTMAKDLGNAVTWNSQTGTLSLVK